MKQLKHWQDSANAVLGVWLIFSPLILGFRGDLVALTNGLIVGVLLVAAALGAILVPRMWEEWSETALGLWLIVSPWILQFNTQAARACAVITGLLVLTFALWALQDYEIPAVDRTAH